MTMLKLTRVGKAVGVELPEELLAKLDVSEGDFLVASDVPNGIELRPCQPDTSEFLEAAERIMKQYHGALRELAK